MRSDTDLRSSSAHGLKRYCRSVSGRRIPSIASVSRRMRSRARWAPAERSTAATRTGTSFPIEISLSPVATDEGLLVVAAVRDATLRRDKEDQLVAENRQKSRFLAAASHDLRQPLQTLNLLNRAAKRQAGENASDAGPARAAAACARFDVGVARVRARHQQARQRRRHGEPDGVRDPRRPRPAAIRLRAASRRQRSRAHRRALERKACRPIRSSCGACSAISFRTRSATPSAAKSESRAPAAAI